MAPNNVTNNSTTDSSMNNTTGMNNLPPGACAHAAPLPAGATTCRTDEECMYGCGYIDSGPGCGALFVPGQECVEDGDCGDGRVCEPLFCGENDRCCEGEGTQCVDSCEVTPCADGFDCGADGHCSPRSCEDGFDCADRFVCDPERLDAQIDEHGCTPETCLADGAPCPDGRECDDGAAGNPNGTCVPVKCTGDGDCRPNEVCTTPDTLFTNGCVLANCATDADCACGACVNDECQPRIFVCLSPAAP